jgi:large subunit ribosomal protein L15e
LYRYISEAWRQHYKEGGRLIRDRVIEWRRGPTMVRVERPSRLDRARMLGYKAKQGFVVVRIRVAKGGMRKSRPRMGRRPKHLGVVKIKSQESMQKVAERRVAKKYPNLKVLNSYYLFEDGKHYWYEVILVDPNHPAIKADKDLKWLAA